MQAELVALRNFIVNRLGKTYMYNLQNKPESYDANLDI